jgi:hypothetical protein
MKPRKNFIVCCFETKKMTIETISNKIKKNNIQLSIGGVYSNNFLVHFYFKSRYAVKIQNLFQDKKHFKIKLSRFKDNY